jgi:hypothetical protein
MLKNDFLLEDEGKQFATEGRRCLCNALLVNVGIGQSRSWNREKPLYTAGDQFENFPEVLLNKTGYLAKDVIEYLYGVSTRSRESVARFPRECHWA